MKFTSGRHLTNYILKIFRNNNIDMPIENISTIKDLSHIFTFVENLPNKVKENIDIPNEYYNWILLAQNGNYKELTSISEIGNANIIKFTNNPVAISFDEVFKSFKLDVKYNRFYLYKKPISNDIYYPHNFKILEECVENAKWNIAYYSKPDISEEDKIGCYFIYDVNEELVYIGKSNTNLFSRSCESAIERVKGNFSKIELYPMPTQADTNIYELYYIAIHNPKYNINSCCNDRPSFILPKQNPKYVINKSGIKSYDIEQIFPSVKYIPVEEYWDNPKKYFLQLEDTYDMKKFNQFFSQNKHGFIGMDKFREQVSELQNEGYITFVFNDRNSCFRQFL